MEHISTKQAAVLLRCHEGTIRRYCRTGALKTIQLGRAYLILVTPELAALRADAV